MASFAKKYGCRVVALSCALLAPVLVLDGVACVADPADDGTGVAQQGDAPTFPTCPDGGATLLAPPQPYQAYVGYSGYVPEYAPSYAPSWYGGSPYGAWGPGGLGYSSLAYGGYAPGGYEPAYGGYSPGYGYGSGYLGMEGAYGGWPGYYGGPGTYGYGLPEGYGPGGVVPPGYGVMATADGGVSLCQQ